VTPVAEETAGLTYGNQIFIMFVGQQRAREPPLVPKESPFVTVGFRFESCKPDTKTNVKIAQTTVR
jgi:hypothetical protein